MPRYYFTVRNGASTPVHSDGIDLPDIASAWVEATKSTGEILRDMIDPIEVGSELRMEVADETRKPILSLRVVAQSHQ